MRKLILPVLLVAAFGCSKDSALEEMNAAKPAENKTTEITSTSRTTAYSGVEGSWRRIETRYNRGNGTHYWVSLPTDLQFKVTFENGKLFAGGHPYLQQFNEYRETHPGTLELLNGSSATEAYYVASGSILEITYRQREEVVDRFVKQ